MALNMFNVIRAAILSLALLLCVIGTFVQQVRIPGSSASYTDVYLYGSRSTYYGTSRFAPFGNACSPFTAQMYSALAFAIIGFVLIGLSLTTVILTFISSFNNRARALNIISLGLSLTAFLITSIAWSLVAAVFDKNQCGYYSYKQIGANLDAGFGLLIVSSLLLIADSIFGCVAVGRAAQEERAYNAQTPMMSAQQQIYSPYNANHHQSQQQGYMYAPQNQNYPPLQQSQQAPAFQPYGSQSQQYPYHQQQQGSAHQYYTVVPQSAVPPQPIKQLD